MALGRGADCGLKARGGGEVRSVLIRSGRQGNGDKILQPGMTGWCQ